MRDECALRPVNFNIFTHTHTQSVSLAMCVGENLHEEYAAACCCLFFVVMSQ